MARGAEAKLRRRNRRKAEQQEGGPIDMFGDQQGGDDDGDGDLPMPPIGNAQRGGAAVIEDDTDDDDDNHEEHLPKQKKKKNKNRAGGGTPVVPPGSKSGGGIKTTPLILLLLMVGTTLLPAVIYLGDYLSAYLAKNNLSGSLGYRLGIGAVPKKRVISFYEKHAPEKLNDVPTILSKHYGDYPTLIKKLERKYQDYGYFVGWEEDEAPLTIAKQQLHDLYDVWLQQYWNRYAPQFLKTAFRNIRYNLTTINKKGRKLFKKHLWPYLEPIFGVPDGAAAQKRKDAAEFRRQRDLKQKKKNTGRRRNTDYRDDVEED